VLLRPPHAREPRHAVPGRAAADSAD